MKRLVITADGLGDSPGVTRGILEAHHVGVVTGASLLVNTPHSADAAGAVIEKTSNLAVGLQINFTFGRPVSPLKEVSSLVDRDGCFRIRTPQDVASSDQSHIEKEASAQYRHFLSLMKRPPVQVSILGTELEDSKLWIIALALARENNLIIRASTEEARRAAELNGVRTCDHVLSNRSVYGDEPEWTFDRLVIALSRLKPGITELVCHPGYFHDEILNSSGYSWQREAELRLFGSPALRKYVERSAVLVTGNTGCQP